MRGKGGEREEGVVSGKRGKGGGKTSSEFSWKVARNKRLIMGRAQQEE